MQKKQRTDSSYLWEVHCTGSLVLSANAGRNQRCIMWLLYNSNSDLQVGFFSARSLFLLSPPLLISSQMAPGYAVAVMGIDFTLRYFYKVLLDLLPICNQDKGNKIR